ncbi:MAG: ATP-binding protein, partial [Treponema sp.]
DEKYMLYQIINARYNAQKSLVVTANMDVSKFLTYIGGAASDRFTENGDMKELKWDSYRIALRQVNV